eukprot:2169649-Pyramimonas_sp.AAC.1
MWTPRGPERGQPLRPLRPASQPAKEASVSILALGISLMPGRGAGRGICLDDPLAKQGAHALGELRDARFSAQ